MAIKHRVLCIMSLIAIAGLPASLVVAQDSGVSRPVPQSATKGDRAMLASCHKLIGLDIVNAQGEKVGDLNNLVIDRGSGEIRSVIVKSGATLGLGGRSVAIPYKVLRWDHASGNPQLDLTPTQLKDFPAFDKSQLTGRESERSALENIWRSMNPDDAKASYEPVTGERLPITGIITNVERTSDDNQSDVIVTVKTDRDGVQRVNLGPTWYVLADQATPMRGAKLVGEIVKTPNASNADAVAMSAKIDNRELALRDKAGMPRWAVQPGSAALVSRLELITSMHGAKAQTLTKDCGKVAEIIIEQRSGRAAFVSIDPDENFLGVADTDRLLPWSVVSFGADGVARVDATKEMILAAPTMPEKVSDLNDPEISGMIYRTYGVSQPDFSRDVKQTAKTRTPKAK